jgi:hypothetical protein
MEVAAMICTKGFSRLANSSWCPFKAGFGLSGQSRINIENRGP